MRENLGLFSCLVFDNDACYAQGAAAKLQQEMLAAIGFNIPTPF